MTLLCYFLWYSLTDMETVFNRNRNLIASLIVTCFVWIISIVHSIIPLTTNLFEPVKVYSVSSTCAPLHLTPYIVTSVQRMNIILYFAGVVLLICIVVMTVFIWKGFGHPQHHHIMQNAEKTLLLCNLLAVIPTLFLGNCEVHGG